MQTVYGIGEYATGQGAVTCWSRAALQHSTRRTVMVVHGAGGNALTALTQPDLQILAALAEAGYPVHCGDYSSSTWKDSSGNYWNFGNSDSVTQIGAGITFMGNQGAKTDKVMLVGLSMGCCAALNYYKANPTKVLALALILPLLDLNALSSNDRGFIGAASNSFVAASMYGQTLPKTTITLSETVASAGIVQTGPPGLGATANTVNILTSNGWQVVTFTGISGSTLTGASGGTGTLSSTSAVSQGYGASLVNAYGVTWPSLLSGTQLSANSPVAWAESSGALKVPVHIWSSDNDPVASNTASSQAFSTAVAGAGGGNTTPVVESLGSTSHVLFSFPSAEVPAFFDANGGRS